MATIAGPSEPIVGDEYRDGTPSPVSTEVGVGSEAGESAGGVTGALSVVFVSAPGGGSVETGGGSVETGGGSVETGGGSVETGGGSVETGGGSVETGGGSVTVETGGGSVETGGGSVAEPTGSTAAGGGSVAEPDVSVAAGGGSVEAGGLSPGCGGSALAVPTNADAQTATPTRARVPIRTRGARRRRLRGSRLLRTTTHLPSTALSSRWPVPFGREYRTSRPGPPLQASSRPGGRPVVTASS